MLQEIYETRKYVYFLKLSVNTRIPRFTQAIRVFPKNPRKYVYILKCNDHFYQDYWMGFSKSVKICLILTFLCVFIGLNNSVSLAQQLTKLHSYLNTPK